MSAVPAAGNEPAALVEGDGVTRKPGPLKTLWRRIRTPLARSRFVKSILTNLVWGGLNLIKATNPFVPGSLDPAIELATPKPTIFVLWHGQHLMSIAYNPPHHPVVAMFSKSADAELNAQVARKFGLEVVRGSGGRDREKTVEKGGIRALIALKRALDQGKSVCMIADIPHGTPRESGMGVVMLARLSGCPIRTVAYASSRRKVLEKSWDKTTINLPFGRSAVCFGEPIHVPRGADDETLEACRRAVTDDLNAMTHKAYALVDGAS